MTRPPDRRLGFAAALATVLAVGGVGHGLHALFGIGHGCGDACCESAATPTFASRGWGRDGDSAVFATPSGSDAAQRCLVCELINSYRSTAGGPPDAPWVSTVVARPAVARDRPPVAADKRLPPSRGPPVLS